MNQIDNLIEGVRHSRKAFEVALASEKFTKHLSSDMIFFFENLDWELNKVQSELEASKFYV